MKRNVVVLLLIVALAGIAVYQNFATSKKVTLPKEQAPQMDYLAPHITLQDIDGKSYEIGGKRDKVLLINFWASWCEPCILEAPDLVDNYKKYKDDLEIYAINATEVDNKDDAKAFVKKYKLTFPVLYDLDGRMVDMYRVPGFPTNFIVDRNGVIRDVIQGVKSPDELERRLKKIIKG